jgi:hypothetical protein
MAVNCRQSGLKRHFAAERSEFMTTSQCAYPGCGATITRPGPGRPKKFCPEHEGMDYGREHRALRRQWSPKVEAGGVLCHAVYCVNPGGREIRPGTAWHLGHTRDRTSWTGPEHALCNSADGGRRSVKVVVQADGSGSAAAAKSANRAEAAAPARRVRDPGPPRPNVVHDEGCHCEETARHMGVWPSQCW